MMKEQEEFRLQTAIATPQALRRGASDQFHRLFAKLPGMSREDEGKPLPEVESKLLDVIQERVVEQINSEMLEQSREEGDMAKRKLDTILHKASKTQPCSKQGIHILQVEGELIYDEERIKVELTKFWSKIFKEQEWSSEDKVAYDNWVLGLDDGWRLSDDLPAMVHWEDMVEAVKYSWQFCIWTRWYSLFSLQDLGKRCCEHPI